MNLEYLYYGAVFGLPVIAIGCLLYYLANYRPEYLRASLKFRILASMFGEEGLLGFYTFSSYILFVLGGAAIVGAAIYPNMIRSQRPTGGRQPRVVIERSRELEEPMVEASRPQHWKPPYDWVEIATDDDRFQMWFEKEPETSEAKLDSPRWHVGISYKASYGSVSRVALYAFKRFPSNDPDAVISFLDVKFKESLIELKREEFDWQGRPAYQWSGSLKTEDGIAGPIAHRIIVEGNDIYHLTADDPESDHARDKFFNALLLAELPTSDNTSEQLAPAEDGKPAGEDPAASPTTDTDATTSDQDQNDDDRSETETPPVPNGE